MKLLLTFIPILLLSTFSYSQSNPDIAGVKKACMGYLDGFYEGDTMKIILRALPGILIPGSQ